MRIVLFVIFVLCFLMMACESSPMNTGITGAVITAIDADTSAATEKQDGSPPERSYCVAGEAPK